MLESLKKQGSKLDDKQSWKNGQKGLTAADVRDFSSKTPSPMVITEDPTRAKK